jgi:TonB family protein
MRHLPIARPAAAMIAACMMTTTPFALCQTPATPAAAAPAVMIPAGAQAVAAASTPEALTAELVGKTFYLRGFYQDDKLEFAMDGKPVGNPQRGSFALSGVEIDKVKFNKRSMEIEAHRVGLHFFGALPYEDDTKPFERIKVDPKKSMHIEVDRLVIEPEKKKKKKDEKKDEKDKKDHPAIASEKQTPGPAAKDKQDEPAVAAAAPATPAQPSPEHDPRVSFLQLSKALNVMFAPALDESVIATLPAYWQNYFATKAGKARAQRVDATALRPGGDVKPPRLLTTIDPTSNEYAQKNNIAGRVFLQMVVDASGRPGDVTIVRPIGFGLDEEAVGAVQHSQFRAGTLNGKPVPELVNLQVTFRIYSNRTKPRPGAPAAAPTPTEVAPKETPRMPRSNGPVLASLDATTN